MIFLKPNDSRSGKGKHYISRKENIGRLRMPEAHENGKTSNHKVLGFSFASDY